MSSRCLPASAGFRRPGSRAPAGPASCRPTARSSGNCARPTRKLVPAEQREAYLKHRAAGHGLPLLQRRLARAEPAVPAGRRSGAHREPRARRPARLPAARRCAAHRPRHRRGHARHPRSCLQTVQIHMEEREVDLVWRAAVPYPGRDWLPQMRRMEVCSSGEAWSKTMATQLRLEPDGVYHRSRRLLLLGGGGLLRLGRARPRRPGRAEGEARCDRQAVQPAGRHLQHQHRRRARLDASAIRRRRRYVLSLAIGDEPTVALVARSGTIALQRRRHACRCWLRRTRFSEAARSDAGAAVKPKK